MMLQDSAPEEKNSDGGKVNEGENAQAGSESKKSSKSKKQEKQDARKAKAASKKKLVAEAKVVEALDAEVSRESFGADKMDDVVVAAAVVASKKARAAKLENADDEDKSAKPKRRRRTKPSAPEEQQKEAAIADVFAQVLKVKEAAAPQSEQAEEARDAKNEETGVAEQEKAANEESQADRQDPLIAAAPSDSEFEKMAEDFFGNFTSRDDEIVWDGFGDSKNEKKENAENASESSDDAENDSPFFDLSNDVKNDAISAEIARIADAFEKMSSDADCQSENDAEKSETPVAENVVENAPVASIEEPKTVEGVDVSFWDVDDSIELDWGSCAVKREAETPTPEPRVVEETAPEESVEAVETVEETPAAEESEVVETAVEEEKGNDFFDFAAKLEAIDFSDNDNLSQFFASPDDEEDLGFSGFTARKEKKPRQEKGSEKREAKADAKCETFSEKKSKRDDENKCRCERCERVESVACAENSEASVEEKDERFDEGRERPRREPRQRRVFEENVQEREICREPRRRQPVQDEADEFQPREPRRRQPVQDEVDDFSPRQRVRREQVNIDADSEQSDERRPAAPERVLPSWNDAISYVVKYNISRRINRGRCK